MFFGIFVLNRVSNLSFFCLNQSIDLSICIGNQMISSAIWKKIFKDYKKLHEPVGRVQFVVFEKFTSAYLFQIAREKSFDYLLIIYK